MKKSKILKFVLMIFVIAIIILALIYILPVVKELSTPEGQQQFKDKINSLGFLGFAVLFGLQIAQIFLVIIPGEPIEILAGACYGPVGGFFFIAISSALITSMIMILVGKLGRKFVYAFCSKEKIDKIENSALFKNPQKVEMIMFLLFLIPGTPKDLLVYIAALLPIKPLRFIIISTIARVPSIISSTLAGDNLIAGNWKVSIIVYIVTFAIVGISIFLINKFDKSKTTKDVLDNIKNS